MAAGKYAGLTLDVNAPIEDMVKGLEPIFPVGMRGMALAVQDGQDEDGKPKFTVTDLKPIQDELHKKDDNWDWDKQCFKDPEQFYSGKYTGGKTK